MNQGMNYTGAIFLVYKERHASSTDCTTYHECSSYWSLRKQQWPLPMLSQPFQPSLMRFEKVEQPTKNGFFANRTRNNSTNPTNLKRLIPIEHNPNPLSEVGLCLIYKLVKLSDQRFHVKLSISSPMEIFELKPFYTF